MSYTLYRFGNTILPKYNAESDVSTGDVEDLLLKVPGGSYDALGSEQAVQLPGSVYKRFLLFFEDDPGDKWEQSDLFRSFRALIGKRERLYRRWGDEAIEWSWARCAKVSGVRVPRHHFVDVTMEFQRISPVWYGHAHFGPWFLDSGIYLDTGYFLDEADLEVAMPAGASYTLELPNEGNAYVDSLIITIHAATSNITAMEISDPATDVTLDFAATITAGQDLVIDTGAQSVKNNGVAAYDDFSFANTGDRVNGGWIFVPPGGTELTFDPTGGGTGSYARVQYYEAWQ